MMKVPLRRLLATDIFLYLGLSNSHSDKVACEWIQDNAIGGQSMDWRSDLVTVTDGGKTDDREYVSRE